MAIDKQLWEEKLALLSSWFYLGLLVYLLRHWSYDDPYITFRYTYNLVYRKEFAYNIGERILSTTSPFFAVLLAMPALFVDNIPLIASLVGCFALAASGFLFWRIGKIWGYSLLSWVGLILFPVFPLPISTLSSETPLYICAALLSFFLYEKGKYSLAFLATAFMVFFRPDGVILPIILFCHYCISQKKIPLFPIGIFLIINLIWWGFLWTYFGSPIPVTLFAKQQQGEMAISQKFFWGFFNVLKGYQKNPLYWLEAIFALSGVFSAVRKRHRSLILVGYTFLYFLAYSVLGVSRYFWYYAPLVPGFILMMGLGFQWFWDVSNRLTPGANRSVQIALLLIVGVMSVNQLIGVVRLSLNPDKRIRIYRDIGRWITQHTAPSAKIGALEIGVIGYYADRYMVDFAGLLQPEVAKIMSKTSTYEDTALFAISNYKPNYVVLHEGGFPKLEVTLENSCQKVKRFNGKNYGVTYNLSIYSCYYSAGGKEGERKSPMEVGALGELLIPGVGGIGFP